MTTTDILFSLGNLLFLIASYPMIKTAIVNRNSLKGFSFIGSLFTFLGMGIMITAFVIMNSWLAALLAIPTIAYWGIVTWYNK